MNTLLKNKNILIMGVANKWSIAWAIAKVFHKAGAKLAFTYLGEKTKKSIEKLMEKEAMDNVLLIPCDVTKDEEIENTFNTLKDEFGTLDSVVHSIAHAKKEELEGEYVDTSREGYMMAQEISAYSLVAVTKYAKPLMGEGGSFVALTYLGGERVVKNYNVMGVAKAALESSVKYLAHDLGKDGIRVNAISAGPIKTLAAKGISDFNNMLKAFEEKSPMGRLIDTEEVGNTALFLCSDLSSGVNGENIHVDCGYHVLGY
jgi:enoyl-[acyl-carrier protein] reductase I